MSHGFVYVMRNEAMPNMVKVGYTTRPPGLRVAELSGATGVPLPFKLVAYIEVADCEAVERRLHSWLSNYRVSRGREFFEGKFVLQNVLRWMHFLPDRLAFCEAGGPGEYFIAGEFGCSLAQTVSPWFTGREFDEDHALGAPDPCQLEPMEG